MKLKDTVIVSFIVLIVVISTMKIVILLGKRKVFRLGERIGILAMKALSIFFLGSLKKYKPIQAQNVAKAMVSIAQNHDQKTVFESNELN